MGAKRAAGGRCLGGAEGAGDHGGIAQQHVQLREHELGDGDVGS